MFAYAIVSDSVYLFNYPMLFECQGNGLVMWCAKFSTIVSSIQMQNHRNNNDVGLVSIHTRKRCTASLRRIILKNYFVKNNMRIVFVQVIKINSKQKNWVLKPHRHITHAYLFFTSSFVLMLLLPPLLLLLLLWFAWFR